MVLFITGKMETFFTSSKRKKKFPFSIKKKEDQIQTVVETGEIMAFVVSVPSTEPGTQ